MFEVSKFYALKSEMTRLTVEGKVRVRPPRIKRLVELMPSEWDRRLRRRFAKPLVAVYTKPEPYFSDCIRELERTQWRVRDKATFEDAARFDTYCKGVYDKFEPQRSTGRYIGTLRSAIQSLEKRLAGNHGPPWWLPVMANHSFVAMEPNREGKFVWQGNKTQIEGLYRAIVHCSGRKPMSLKSFARLFVLSDGTPPNYDTLKNHVGELPSPVVEELTAAFSDEKRRKSNN